jgi:hypothetical protein
MRRFFCSFVSKVSLPRAISSMSNGVKAPPLMNERVEKFILDIRTGQSVINIQDVSSILNFVECIKTKSLVILLSYLILSSYFDRYK